MRASHLVFLLVSAYVLAECTGRTVDDSEDEADYENWPVLCPPENYYNKQLENCVPCSRCPLNNIITSPCYRFQDTKCGPFLDFETVQKLHGDSSEESKEDSKEDGLSFPQTENDDLDGSNQASDTAAEDSLDEQKADRHWKIVALKMSLIIGGCVVLLLVAIIVGIVCIKRRLMTEKKLVCEYMPPPGAAANVIDC